MVQITRGWTAEARLLDARYALTKDVRPETLAHFKATLDKIDEALAQLKEDLNKPANHRNSTSIIMVPVESSFVRGDFGMRVQGEWLLMPRMLFTAASKLKANSLETFLSILEHFPSALAEILDWRPEEMEEATSKLHEQLRGHVPDHYLERAPTQSFGAKNPSSQGGGHVH
jgi:hypothetical protein